MTGPKIDPPAVETHAAFAERSGATALVAQRLMDDIRQGVWRPGDKLPTERQLAANLGLREALRALEILGLIQVRQGSGVFVSSLSAEQLLTPLRFFISLDAGNIEALFEARINLEATVAGLAAERASEEELAQIRAALKSPSGRIGEIEPFLEADVYFHQLIAKAAHNAILERIVSSLSVLGRASR
ncbi:MAG TPA: GntR family transcriptional regulator, partial [Parvularculaceae bacterium]|nr:GntR family transcriptional regulator [Parvularculaceae bacterium]